MKKLITAALSLMFAVGLSGLAVAGSFDSTGAPSAGSGMYTLQNLYDYLTSGTALTVQTSFQEPTSGPGSTMKSTKQIGDAVATPFAQCATTTAANVESGKKFFCTQTDSWGVKTGTLVVGCPEGKSCYMNDHSDITLISSTDTTTFTHAAGYGIPSGNWEEVQSWTYTSAANGIIAQLGYDLTSPNDFYAYWYVKLTLNGTDIYTGSGYPTHTNTLTEKFIVTTSPKVNHMKANSTNTIRLYVKADKGGCSISNFVCTPVWYNYQ
ncbi:MAG: hypothetical protein NTZ78_02620 [Candidatus Aureabacteria bacterium]|nr:hypothetical protein [Candidatus Auribacterota bacterium]